MTWIERLEMIANFAVAVAVVFSAIALCISACALKLQKKSLRANLFYEISKRINELEDQWADCEAKEDEEMWYERLFSTFEQFAFFANRGYLEEDMKEYYSAGIKDCVDRLEKYPELLEYFKTRHSGQFEELEKYYQSVIGEELPF